MKPPEYSLMNLPVSIQPVSDLGDAFEETPPKTVP